MIDLPNLDLPAYEPPALVQLGSIVDMAGELDKLGFSTKPVVDMAVQATDWSNGRIS